MRVRAKEAAAAQLAEQGELAVSIGYESTAVASKVEAFMVCRRITGKRPLERQAVGAAAACSGQPNKVRKPAEELPGY